MCGGSARPAGVVRPPRRALSASASPLLAAAAALHVADQELDRGRGGGDRDPLVAADAPAALPTIAPPTRFSGCPSQRSSDWVSVSQNAATWATGLTHPPKVREDTKTGGRSATSRHRLSRRGILPHPPPVSTFY